MKGDFTRDTFDPLRHFSRVLMQQGRVQLDADFNEQAAILLHYLRTLAKDLIGPYGGPEGDGFKIMFVDDKLTIGAGRYYVDGILCENDGCDPEKGLAYKAQVGFADDDKPKSDKTYVAYLDVWERHITHVQDERIRETALGAPDTCTRAQVVWQVKLQEWTPPEGTLFHLLYYLPGWQAPDPTCDSLREWLAEGFVREPNNLLTLTRGELKARLQSESGNNVACSIPPAARYRGLENHLYRIEIHRGGEAWNGETGSGGAPEGNFATAATFKWSRDNGSHIFPIVRLTGSTVTVQSLGRDLRTSLKPGDWVEMMDDGIELRGETGILAQVKKEPDPVAMTVELELASGGKQGSYEEKSTNHPLLRRWDQRAVDGLAMHQGAILISESRESDDGWIEIENGIEVQFQPPAGDGNPPPRVYRTGDNWLISARVATGDIEWPPELDDKNQVVKDSNGNEVPEALPPHGVEHRYAPLAVIENGSVNEDCRCRFSLSCEPYVSRVLTDAAPKTL